MSTVKTAIRARVSMTLNRCAATNASYSRTRRTPIDPSFCALMRWYKDLRDDEFAPKSLDHPAPALPSSHQGLSCVALRTIGRKLHLQHLSLRGRATLLESSVMKCANPDCNRSIGLVSYRRGWFSTRRYCSKHCRHAFVADAPKLQQKRSALRQSEARS